MIRKRTQLIVHAGNVTSVLSVGAKKTRSATTKDAGSRRVRVRTRDQSFSLNGPAPAQQASTSEGVGDINAINRRFLAKQSDKAIEPTPNSGPQLDINEINREFWEGPITK